MSDHGPKTKHFQTKKIKCLENEVETHINWFWFQFKFLASS
jgi:hypothetical protein